MTTKDRKFIRDDHDIILGMSIVLILNNIRSVENVGSIFRTADGAGVEKIYLVGVTPDPIDRFGRNRTDMAKVALGAEKSIPWEHYSDISLLIKQLRKNPPAGGLQIIALEQSKKSVYYKKFKPVGSAALIVGNEVDGIADGILRQCDAVIEIPMKGKKESLNVSVATGIALFELTSK